MSNFRSAPHPQFISSKELQRSKRGSPQIVLKNVPGADRHCCRRPKWCVCVRGGLPNGLVARLRRRVTYTTQIVKPDMPSFVLRTAFWPLGGVWVGHVAPERFAIHFGRTTHGQQTDDTRQLRTWDGIVFYMQERHDM